MSWRILSRKKRKMMRSPHNAPRPPKKAMERTECEVCAMVPSAAMAGAVVNAEVKKKPARKLSRNQNLLVHAINAWRVPVWMRWTARKTLRMIVPKSRQSWSNFVFIALFLKIF